MGFSALWLTFAPSYLYSGNSDKHGWPSTQPGSLHTAVQRKYTQPCSLFSRGTAVWTMGARLCEQWGTAVCNARLCRGSPVIRWRRHLYIEMGHWWPSCQGAFLPTWINGYPSMDIRNYIHHRGWDDITWNSIEVEWKSNSITQYNGVLTGVIIYPCWGLSQSVLVK